MKALCQSNTIINKLSIRDIIKCTNKTSRKQLYKKSDSLVYVSVI